MKRVIGILGVLAISMLLGMSLGWAEECDLTLVSTYPAAIGE